MLMQILVNNYLDILKCYKDFKSNFFFFTILISLNNYIYIYKKNLNKIAFFCLKFNLNYYYNIKNQLI